MASSELQAFDVATFPANAGLGRRIVQLECRQTLFSQGDSADSVFYVQKGRVKISVVSATGKEATITFDRRRRSARGVAFACARNASLDGSGPHSLHRAPDRKG
jgi:CRP-like cAMP-binding protein